MLEAGHVTVGHTDVDHGELADEQADTDQDTGAPRASSEDVDAVVRAVGLAWRPSRAYPVAILKGAPVWVRRIPDVGDLRYP